MIALKMIKIVTVHWHGFRDVPGYDNAGYEIADSIEGHMHCDVIVLVRNDVQSAWIIIFGWSSLDH